MTFDVEVGTTEEVNPLFPSSVAEPDEPTTAVKPRVKDAIGTDPAFNSWVKGGCVLYVSDTACLSTLSRVRSAAPSSRQPIHILFLVLYIIEKRPIC